jgi:hypothetical protein
MGNRTELEYKGNIIQVNVSFCEYLEGWSFKTLVIRHDANEEKVKPIDSLCDYMSKEEAIRQGIAFGKKIIDIEIGPS